MRSVLLSSGLRHSDMDESQKDISFSQCNQLKREGDIHICCVEMPEELGKLLTDNVFKYL
jgi:hypothetical protein